VRSEARSHFETELELQLERQRTSLSVSMPISPTRLIPGIQVTQSTSGQLQPGQTLVTPSQVRPGASATRSPVVQPHIEPVMDVNTYILPATSSGH